MKSDRFYLACLRDTVGTNISFHGECGYSTDIDRARVYSREQAQAAWDSGREFDMPLCADQVDALAVFHVDCQYLPAESAPVEGCDRYVAYQTQRWDGNDVYWLRDSGLPTTDFSQATIFETPGDDTGLVWLPFSVVDAVKRRTICESDVDRRKMVQGAGLLMPDHVKRSRNSKSSGKTRWNCPSCGRITWQYNPYDYEGCKNIDCEAWEHVSPHLR